MRNLTLHLPDYAEPFEIALHEWGQVGNPPIVCVHGLTRNAMDFHFLAEAFAANHYVIAPDLPGRGVSPWLKDPALYNNEFNSKLMLQLLNQLNLQNVRWVSTSMGGIIGMILAATVPGLIHKLVLNDVGADIPVSALQRLKEYVGRQVSFESYEQGEAALRRIFQPFGLKEEIHWQHLLQHSLIEKNGQWLMRYDPAIGDALQQIELQPINLWPIWNLIQCPVLLLRGSESDILPKVTAQNMLQSKSDVEYMEFPGVGHAPALYDEAQISIIKQWIDGK